MVTDEELRTLRLEEDAARARVETARTDFKRAKTEFNDAVSQHERAGMRRSAAEARARFERCGPLAVWLLPSGKEGRVSFIGKEPRVGQVIRVTYLDGWFHDFSMKTGRRSGWRGGPRIDVAATVAAFEAWKAEHGGGK